MASVKQNNSYIIENLEDIDVSHITFMEPKKNAHGGNFINMKYKGKTLYVRYDSRTCPFGVSESDQDVSKSEPGKYPGDKKITGYSTSIQMLKDYNSDPYLAKLQELDEFIMDAAHKNALAWGLGGTKTRPLAREAIEGYDDRGADGKWKRLVKWSYKKDQATNERIYNDQYPPRHEFSIPIMTKEETKGKDGMYKQSATFRPTFFDAEGKKIEGVTSDNVAEVIPKWSRVSLLAQWSNLTQGTYGISLKPKLHQIRVFPSEKLSNDECLLGGAADDDDEQEDDLPDALGDMMAPVAVKKVAKKAPVKVESEDEDDEEIEVEEEEEEKEEEEDIDIVDEDDASEEDDLASVATKPVARRPVKRVNLSKKK